MYCSSLANENLMIFLFDIIHVVLQWKPFTLAIKENWKVSYRVMPESILKSDISTQFI